MQLRSILMVVAVAACGSGAAPNTGVGNASTTSSPPVRTETTKENPLVAKAIGNLRDPRLAEAAVAELETLGDPIAIQPLGEHWKETKNVYALRVMISLARPLTPEQAKTTFLTDYETTGRPASWDRLLPYLRIAIASIDVENPRSVDSAQRAAQTVEEARLAGALVEVTELAMRPPLKKSIAAEIAAIRAVGTIGGTDATRTLLGLIGRVPPPHPRAQPSRELQRAAEESFALYLSVTGASINALPALTTVDEVEVLIKQMYLTPELFLQLRRALVANGALAGEPLRRVIRSEHTAVNDVIQNHKLGLYCGDAGDLPVAQCKVVSIRDFYAAAILGDLRDAAAVPDLLAVLKRPASPAYYIEDQPAATTQHAAAFDALRKIGSAAPVPQLRTTWRDPKLALEERVLALAAYGVLARDAADVDELGKIAANNTADDTLRTEAATTYARLARDPKHVALLLTLANKYVDASAKKRVAADKLKPTADKADAVFAKAEKAMVDAKQTLVRIANDSSTSADQIIRATATKKTAEETYKTAKKKHKDQIAPYRQADLAAKSYTAFARMFQSHVARVEIAIRCKDELPCFAAILTEKPELVVKAVKPYLDASTWSSAEQEGLLDAAIDRALLEISKRGPAASAYTDVLLDRLMRTNGPLSRSLGEGILLALPKIAPRPCPGCVTKLDAANLEGRYEDAMPMEGRLVRSYFTWAK